MITQTENPSPDRATVALRWALGAVLAIILIATAWLAYAYYSSPLAIRAPASTHIHFRLQIINAGVPVDFGSSKFQTPFNKGICTAAITSEPIHFHDNLDQFVHVHWAHITGGIFLKDYGWNQIGGPDGILGYNFSHLPHVDAVKIHGSVLPTAPAGAHYYIFTGSADNFLQRSWNDFLTQDLSTFFTEAPGPSMSWLEGLSPAVAATSEPDPSMPGMDMPAAQSEEQLSKLNHVVGSAVIFVQRDKPTDEQIKDRFNRLIPLPTSSCGG